MLFRIEPLGGRKLSELLAAMLELCPRGHETSIFFTHLFLGRLPAELRIMLGKDNHQNPRDVAKKADSLRGHIGHGGWDLIGGRPLLFCFFGLSWSLYSGSGLLPRHGAMIAGD
jgi:hypothetical protein